MPRIAEPGELDRILPWDLWEAQLKKSPTKALYFSPDDFGEMSPRAFQRKARNAFRHLDVIVRIRMEEVLVVLNAT